MPKNGTEVYVTALPPCDLCTDGTLARYDAKTVQGPWGNLCALHFETYGIGLGVGKGQELKVRDGHS